MKRAGIAVAVVACGAVAIKLLPITVTLSGIVGFAGGGMGKSNYLYGKGLSYSCVTP